MRLKIVNENFSLEPKSSEDISTTTNQAKPSSPRDQGIDLRINKSETKHSSDEVMVNADVGVILVQSLIRGVRARLKFQNLEEKRRIRMHREYLRLDTAARTVQRIWRGYNVRLVVLEFRLLINYYYYYNL